MCSSRFLFAALLFCSPLFAEQHQAPTEWQEVAKRIQRACVEAYPVDILVEMTGADEVPSDLVEDVERQRDFYAEVVDGEKGLFFPYLLEDLLPVFKAYIKPGTTFLDLGSGDGRVVFMAAAMGAEATGIEYEPSVAEISRRALADLGDVLDAERVKIIEDDFFNHSWAEYDYIFYYDRSSFAQKEVRRKLAYELRDEARLLVGFQHLPFHGLEVEAHFGDVTVFRQAPLDVEFQPHIKKKAEKEILDFYEFLLDWYAGGSEGSADDFQRLEDVASASFTLIEPNGRIFNRVEALDHIRSQHGVWRRGDPEKTAANQLKIDEMRLLVIDSTTAVVSFRERRKIDGEERLFRNTAALQLRVGYPNGVVWIYLHRAGI